MNYTGAAPQKRRISAAGRGGGATGSEALRTRDLVWAEVALAGKLAFEPRNAVQAIFAVARVSTHQLVDDLDQELASWTTVVVVSQDLCDDLIAFFDTELARPNVRWGIAFRVFIFSQRIRLCSDGEQEAHFTTYIPTTQ